MTHDPSKETSIHIVEPTEPAPVSAADEAHRAASPWHRLGDCALVRLALYYGLLGSAANGLTRFAPELSEAIERERSRHAAFDEAAPVAIRDAALPVQLGGDESSAVVLLSLLAALLLALPVSWVYAWSSEPKQYSQGFAQALIVFPVAIATVVFLVKGSLALAFSIAGIVAAVRFRTRLSAARDALFIFVAIGIGLAAGVQLLHVAFLASIVFTLASLGLTAIDYGAHPSRLHGMRLRSGRH